MTKHQIEVITSVERRRRWSREEKERLVAATFEAGASASEISQSAGIHVSQLFRWRKEFCQISAPSMSQLVAVEVVEARPAPQPPALQSPISRSRKKSSMVTIELGGARRLRVESDIDSEALGRILDVLERR
ncbi:IS66-like element accessory protein TnpA [Mesorhizobium shangrilense]|uniref:Transposase n=1 Tax=Mesorhizobium shangrilense TaxID=460060 RepID=A0ABV2DSN9_9HYPH